MQSTANFRDSTSRSQVPVLWDKETGTIVNNESSEIIRILGGAAFDSVAKNPALNLYPAALRPAIDEVRALLSKPMEGARFQRAFPVRMSFGVFKSTRRKTKNQKMNPAITFSVCTKFGAR